MPDGIQIESSIGQSILSNDITKLLEYLANQPKADFKLFWDLDNSLAQLFKGCDIDMIERISRNKKDSFKDQSGVEYFITYNTGKVFGVDINGNHNLYYHLKQFYKGLPQPKDETDLQEILQFGQNLMKELNSVGIAPYRLTSPAAFTDQIFTNLKLPTHDDIPEAVNQLAWQCADRPWTEAFKLGHFNEVYDYDVRSGYPSSAKDLLDTRYGEWIHTGKYTGTATYGFYEVRVAIDAKVSPISYLDSKNELIHPNGSWRTWLSNLELDFINQYKLGHFQVHDGWEWNPKSIVKPLQLTVYKMFKNRQKSPHLNKLMKYTMTSLYGLNLQTYTDEHGNCVLGKHFNPVWGALIEIVTKLKVCKFIYDNDLIKDLVLVSTDGVLSTKKVEIKDDGLIGSWKLSSTSPALAVSSSAVFYADKRPCQLTYDEVVELIKENTQATQYRKPVKRRLVLDDLVTGNWNELGKEVEAETGFSIPVEHDREYIKKPTCGQDLLDKTYNSKPLRASKLTKPNLIEEEYEEVI
jgi:hypothetical protein